MVLRQSSLRCRGALAASFLSTGKTYPGRRRSLSRTFAVSRDRCFRDKVRCETIAFPVSPPGHDRIYAVVPERTDGYSGKSGQVPGQTRSQQAVGEAQVDQQTQRAGSEKRNQSLSQCPPFQPAIAEGHHIVEEEIEQHCAQRGDDLPLRKRRGVEKVEEPQNRQVNQKTQKAHSNEKHKPRG